MRLFLALIFLLAALPASAANRFWVGGSATWDATAGTKWATTSGGSGGAAVPTTSDAVFIDGNSGSGTVTYSRGSFDCCASLDMTGYTGTFTLSGTLYIPGSLTLGSGMTAFNQAGNNIGFDGAATLTTNGITLSSASGGNVGCAAGSFTLTLGDNLTMGGSTPGGLLDNSRSCTINTNGKSVTAAKVIFDTGTLTPGASAFTLTGTGTILSITSSATLSSNTATFKLTDASSSSKTIALGSKTTWGTIWLSGAGTGTFIFSGAGTVDTLKADTPPHAIQFNASNTVTFTTWSISGTSGNLMTITSSSSGTPATLSKSSGTVTCDYCSIKDSTATGGATFNATNSTNVSGNTGWNFTVPFNKAPAFMQFFPIIFRLDEPDYWLPKLQRI